MVIGFALNYAIQPQALRLLHMTDSLTTIGLIKQKTLRLKNTDQFGSILNKMPNVCTII